GMPDLDFRIELGPNLSWDIVELDSGQLQLQLPFRAAFSLGSKFAEYQGLTFTPRIYLRLPMGEWRYTATLGPHYSDRRFHDYFYSVAPRFVTADREAFEADGGYSATRLSFSVNRYFNKLFVGGYLRYYNMQGADNRDSPLFIREHNYSVGVIVSWVFSKSKRMVEVDPAFE
ncbi:MAG: MipA/OmpV family protein, partial [Pseudomonadales bacterium]